MKMNSHNAVAKTSCKSRDDSPGTSAGGENGVAMVPPDYGIGFVDGGMAMGAPAQLVGRTTGGSAGVSTPAPAPNRTGLPDKLKSGIENLSGYSMDDVRVHYNSSKPAALNAHAYAQGTEIHLGSGQERHLPHEAWHVVQQKEGRVRPTTEVKGVKINNDEGLEREADVMGGLAKNKYGDSRASRGNLGESRGRGAHGMNGMGKGSFTKEVTQCGNGPSISGTTETECEECKNNVEMLKAAIESLEEQAEIQRVTANFHRNSGAIAGDTNPGISTIHATGQEVMKEQEGETEKKIAEKKKELEKAEDEKKAKCKKK